MLTTRTRDGLLVTLRAHTPDDAPALAAMMSDPATTAWLDDLPDPYLPEHARGFIESREIAWQDPGGADELTLVVDVDGTLVGQVGFKPWGRTGEVGYVMTAAWEGQGIMTAALRRFVTWVLDPDGLDRRSISWRARRGNWASRRVAWAAGFSFDGIGHGRHVERDGTLVDLWLGSLTRGRPLLPADPWLDVPEIRVGELLLREAGPQDVDRIVEACSDPETARRLPILPSPYCRADAEAYLTAVQEEQAVGRSLAWAITAADEPERLLGMVALSGMRLGRDPQCEIGYWVHPDARRRSVATIGCRTATRHALLPVTEGGLGLRAVLLRAGTGNVGSQGVARAAGFTRTGIDPQSEFGRDGEVADFLRHHFTVDQLEDAWAHPSSLR